MTITISKVEVNPTLEASRFAMPAAKPAAEKDKDKKDEKAPPPPKP
jgi:hypothetical protein